MDLTKEHQRFLKSQHTLLQTPLLYPGQLTLIFLYLFAANTVIPLFDIPLLGLSVSALPFGLITLEVLFRLKYVFLKAQRKWLLVTYLSAMGIFLSVAVNAALGNLFVDASMIAALVQAVYWLLVFCVYRGIGESSKP